MTCIEPLQFPVAGDTVLLAVPHVQGRQVGPTVAVSTSAESKSQQNQRANMVESTKPMEPVGDQQSH